MRAASPDRNSDENVRNSRQDSRRQAAGTIIYSNGCFQSILIIFLPYFHSVSNKVR